MKIFLDTASVQDIRQWVSTGLIDGVTTNPTLLAREKRNPIDILQDICHLVQGPVSAELTEEEEDRMIAQGQFLFGLAPNIVIKIPVTPVGLKVCCFLNQEGIPVNVTLCFSLAQAVLAAKAGARYVSPFFGRVEDAGQNAAHLLQDICTCYHHNPLFSTEVLAASLRCSAHVMTAMTCNVHAVTIPPKVFAELYEHPLTQKGIDIFRKDWSILPDHIKQQWMSQS